MDATPRPARPARSGSRLPPQARIVGAPLATERLVHERLGKPTALAVFASDNLSSSAYATEEILRVLVVAGLGTAAFSRWCRSRSRCSLVLGVLLFSYRQTIRAYPQAGGAYLVTRDNFGVLPAQVAGVALLTDYILTVSVSVAAGTAALTSVFEGLHAVARADLARLHRRSSRSATSAACGNRADLRRPHVLLPLMMGILLGDSFVRLLTGSLPEPASQFPLRRRAVAGFALVFLILKAFASGGAAVTGVEAISNGVPAFKPPEWKNAITTLMWMGSLLGAMFLGLSILAARMHIVPDPDEKVTVLAQIAQRRYSDARGSATCSSSWSRSATMLILVLAANTSYADFPRLASFHAGDRFLPRSSPATATASCSPTGSSSSSVFAGLLVIVFKASVTQSDPALRDRCVHVVHVLPGRHGEASHRRCESRGGGRDSRSTGSARWSRRSMTVIIAGTKFSQAPGSS